jgi:hypothetical protein
MILQAAVQFDCAGGSRSQIRRKHTRALTWMCSYGWIGTEQIVPLRREGLRADNNLCRVQRTNINTHSSER